MSYSIKAIQEFYQTGHSFGVLVQEETQFRKQHPFLFRWKDARNCWRTRSSSKDMLGVINYIPEAVDILVPKTDSNEVISAWIEFAFLLCKRNTSKIS